MKKEKHNRMKSVLCMLVLLWAAASLMSCRSTSASTPEVGHYSGTTSQGKPILISIQFLNDHYLISSVQYSIKFEGTDFSGTSIMDVPQARYVLVENGAFSGKFTDGTSAEVWEGTFKDGGIEGRLICFQNAPDGNGVAVADVNFVATLEED
jgi:hypothetical protein